MTTIKYKNKNKKQNLPWNHSSQLAYREKKKKKTSSLQDHTTTNSNEQKKQVHKTPCQYVNKSAILHYKFTILHQQATMDKL
jgi:hypothetical protein